MHHLFFVFQELIQYARRVSAGFVHSCSISLPACEQVLQAFRIIMGRDGTDLGILWVVMELIFVYYGL